MDGREVKEIILRINDEGAKKEINELTKRLENARNAKQALEQKHTNGKSWSEKERKNLVMYTKEIQQCERQLDRMRATGKNVEQVLNNMSGAGPKELKKTVSALNRELNSGAIARGSAEWKRYQQAIREANTELQRIKEEQKAVEPMSTRFAEWGNKWVGITTTITTGLQALTGVSSTMRQSVQDYASMQEAESQVIKYTGMTKKEVHELNEEFKKIDTRTPRERLNALAGDAGRLGITSKESILEFVDAADKINVALGEDLGEDAVKNIGKLAMMFGEDKTKGLRGAMLATGSAINEVAQNSSAAEEYLVEFTARVAGAGKQAGISQANILGYASVLDENMLRNETSATAFQNIMMKMFQEPTKFAQIAGLNVKEFTRLVKDDANEALLQFVTSLSQKGGLSELAPLFDKMKLDGQGAASVLSVMAGKIDDIRERQALANKAYDEGTSLINEFNVQNNTVQAGLDKIKNKFHELSVELGERLEPVASRLISSTGVAYRSMLAVADFLVEHKMEIVRLSIVWGTYAIVSATVTLWEKRKAIQMAVTSNLIKAQIVLQRSWAAATLVLRTAYYLLTGNLTRATAAMRVLNTVTKANPWGLLASAIAAVAMVVWQLVGATKAETDALEGQEKKLNAIQRAQNAASEEMAREKSRVEELTRVLRDNTQSLDTRKTALENLKKIVPGYNAELDKEGRLIRDNRKAIDDYIIGLENMAMAKAVQKELEALSAKELEATLRKRRKQNNVDKVQWQLDNNPRYASHKETRQLSANSYGPEAQIVSQDRVRAEKKKELRIQQEALNKAEQDELQILREKKELQAYSKAKGYDKLLVQEDSGESDKEVEKKRSEIVEAQRQREKDLKKSYDEGLITKKEYRDQLVNIERESLTKQRDLYRVGTKEWEEANDKLLRLEKKQREGQDEVNKAEKERVTKALREIVNAQRQSEEELKGLYATGQINRQDYRDRLAEIERDSLTKQRDVHRANTEEWQKANDKLLEFENKQKEKRANWSEADIDRETEEKKRALQGQLLSEEAYAEETYLIERDALKRKAELWKGFNAEKSAGYEEQLAELDDGHRLAKEKKFLEKLKSMREEYVRKTPQEQMDIELKMLEEMHDRKLIKEEEYERMSAAIRTKYRNADTPKGKPDGRSEREKDIDGMAGIGGSKSSGKPVSDAYGLSDAVVGLGSEFAAKAQMYAKIEQLEQEGVVTHEEAIAAKKRADEEYAANFVNRLQAAYAMASAIMSAYSDYNQACLQAEQAKVSARYDKEIEMAGKDSKRGKALQEQKEKDLAALKNKYNKRAMKIQVAQALAQTAMAAIQAYQSAAAIPVVGYILGPIAAAAAVAAGMMQVAAIKKQQEAQSAGYYEGGFTGGNRYKEEAGIVHEGEFVANHQAVRNPAVLPVLRFIDQAQRNNTIGSLTTADVSRAVGVNTWREDTREPVIHREHAGHQDGGSHGEAEPEVGRGDRGLCRTGRARRAGQAIS